MADDRPVGKKGIDADANKKHSGALITDLYDDEDEGLIEDHHHHNHHHHHHHSACGSRASKIAFKSRSVGSTPFEPAATRRMMMINSDGSSSSAIMNHQPHVSIDPHIFYGPSTSRAMPNYSNTANDRGFPGRNSMDDDMNNGNINSVDMQRNWNLAGGCHDERYYSSFGDASDGSGNDGHSCSSLEQSHPPNSPDSGVSSMDLCLEKVESDLELDDDFEDDDDDDDDDEEEEVEYNDNDDVWELPDSVLNASQREHRITHASTSAEALALLSMGFDTRLSRLLRPMFPPGYDGEKWKNGKDPKKDKKGKDKRDGGNRRDDHFDLKRPRISRPSENQSQSELKRTHDSLDIPGNAPQNPEIVKKIKLLSDLYDCFLTNKPRPAHIKAFGKFTPEKVLPHLYASSAVLRNIRKDEASSCTNLANKCGWIHCNFQTDVYSEFGDHLNLHLNCQPYIGTDGKLIPWKDLQMQVQKEKEEVSTTGQSSNKDEDDPDGGESDRSEHDQTEVRVTRSRHSVTESEASKPKRLRTTRITDHGEISGSKNQYVCCWKTCKSYGMYGTRQWLDQHITKIHAGPKPFKCLAMDCLLRFTTMDAVVRHWESKHNSTDNNRSNGQQPQRDDSEVESEENNSTDSKKPCCYCKCTCHPCLACAASFQICDRTSSNTENGNTSGDLDIKLPCYVTKTNCCRHQLWVDYAKDVLIKYSEKQKQKYRQMARPPKVTTVATRDFISSKTAAKLGHSYRTKLLQKSKLKTLYQTDVNGKKVFNAELFNLTKDLQMFNCSVKFKRQKIEMIESEEKEIFEDGKLVFKNDVQEEYIHSRKKRKLVHRDYYYGFDEIHHIPEYRKVEATKVTGDELQSFKYDPSEQESVDKRLSLMVSRMNRRSRTKPRHANTSSLKPKPLSTPLGVKESLKQGGSLMSSEAYEITAKVNDNDVKYTYRQLKSDGSVTRARRIWYKLPVRCTQIRFYGKPNYSTLMCRPIRGPYFQYDVVCTKDDEDGEEEK